MAKLFLTKENREKLAEVYKRITGEEWKPPKRDSDDFPQLESLSEIDKLMREPSRGAWHEES